MNDTVLNKDTHIAFQKKLEALGISNSNIVTNTIDTNTVVDTTIDQDHTVSSQLTLAEQRAWMLHQQDPLSAAGPFSMALELKGDLNKKQLVQAIKQLYRADSSLNLAYQLDSDGDLKKEHLTCYPVDVPILSIESIPAAINYILELQSISINLSKEPSIRFILFSVDANTTVLGIIGHHILLDDTAWQPIFNALNHYYAKENLPSQPSVFTAPQESLQKSTSYWRTQFPNGLIKTTLPNSYLKRHKETLSISHDGWHNYLDISPAANRFRTVIAIDSIKKFSHNTKVSITHTIVALFSNYIATLFTKEFIDVLMPVVDTNAITALNQIKTSSNVIPIRITKVDTNFNNFVEDTRNQVLMAIENNRAIEEIITITQSQRQALPNILITQFDDAAQHLNLANIGMKSLAVPPLNTDQDITLAFRIEANENLHLEMTLKDIVEPSLGTFLLTQFVDYLQAIVIGKSPVVVSLFPTTDTLFSSFVAQTANNVAVSTNREELATPSVQSPNLALERQQTTDIILNTFKDVLEDKDLTADDNFFELGGHSLLASKVIGKLKTKHNLDIQIVDFFNHPSAKELAKKSVSPGSLGSTGDVQTPTDKHEDDEHREEKQKENKQVGKNNLNRAPLSLLQSSYIELADFGLNPMFNIPYALRFSDSVDETLLQQAFLDVIERHPTLRTLFLPEDDSILQNVIPMADLADYAWFLDSSHQNGEHYQQILDREATTGFNLSKEIPIRVRLLKDDKYQQILSLLIYHLSFDEWSTAIFMQELITAYQTRANGQLPIWQSTPKSYIEYVFNQDREEILGKHLDYWKTYLGKVEKGRPLFSQENELPDDIDYTGAIVEIEFDKTVHAALSRWANIHKASLFHVLYACITLALYYLGAGKKILVGTSMFSREAVAFQDTIGFFTNVVLHQVAINEHLTFAELIAQVKTSILSGLPYSDVPFSIVEDAVAVEEVTDNLCEFYIQFHTTNMLNGDIKTADKTINIELLEPIRDLSKFGLHFEMFEQQADPLAALRVLICYRTQNYNDQQIALIKQTVHALITATAHTEHTATVRTLRKQLFHKIAKGENL
ncbi:MULTISPECIES: condensation domain-containing protein [unclassified Psychrobacter]|uniref:condensation domain-containing protein n=1 Tax=unclassified Psychrobacter TaxID=196806 RepID=UPI000ED25978|nr:MULTISPECIES: condensation domain-containing protein [unclassified Psychrobacter]MBE8610554.1 hypothetical protein [Pseudomonas lundensis]HCI75084.1 hypothetical protein [Psychrobacter sp.]